MASLSSAYEQVIFLDPDVMTLRDPTYLFSTRIFQDTGTFMYIIPVLFNKYVGALFWPDFMYVL